jgi:hypothetical protein
MIRLKDYQIFLAKYASRCKRNQGRPLKRLLDE